MAGLIHRSSLVLMGAIILTFLTIITSGETFAEDLPDELVIGYQDIPNGEIVAKDLRWNEKALGIPIKWIRFGSGMLVNRAMKAGKVDIGLGGSSPCAAGISEGLPYEVIWIHDIIGDNEALVGRKDSGISGVKDLVGKRVAVPFGSTTHYHLLVALRLNSVDPRQVAIINSETPDIFAAWRRGDIDGGFVWEPTLSKMVGSGGKVILSSRQLVKKGFPTCDLCVVRKAFAKRYPSLVVKYLKNQNRAVKLYRSNPENAAAAIARQFGISTTEAAQQMKRLILVSAEEQVLGKHIGDTHWGMGLYTILKETADFLVETKTIKSYPPAVNFLNAVNPYYLEKVLE
jgi:taurine transport system substrate-binding protein